MLSMLFLQTGTSETPTKELRYKISLPRFSHFREVSINTSLLFTHLICCSSKRSWFGLQQSTATVVVVTMKHRTSRSWREWGRKTAEYRPCISWKQTGLFKKLVGGIPWEAALKGRGAQESWQGFNSSTLQAQVQSIPILRKTCKKKERGGGHLSKEVLNKAPKEEFRNTAQACRDGVRKAKAQLELRLQRASRATNTVLVLCNSQNTDQGKCGPMSE